jgi:hypothetical protein
MTLRDWSLGRVVLVSILWALAVLLLSAWRTLNFMRGHGEQGGLAGASAGMSDLLKVAALMIIPPVALVIAWLVRKR